MTSHEEWRLRSEILRASARRMREQAFELHAQAVEMEALADKADHLAVAEVIEEVKNN